MLAEINLSKTDWKEINTADFLIGDKTYFADSLLNLSGASILYTLNDNKFEQGSTGTIKNTVTRYRKSFRVFNFHSWRPVADDPEFGYSFFSDNIVSSFKNTLTYTYNR